MASMSGLGSEIVGRTVAKAEIGLTSVKIWFEDGSCLTVAPDFASFIRAEDRRAR